jgi:hypothetical protein
MQNKQHEAGGIFLSQHSREKGTGEEFTRGPKSMQYSPSAATFKLRKMEVSRGVCGRHRSTSLYSTSLHLLSGRSSACLLYLSGLLSSASLTELMRVLEASEPSEPLSRVAVRSSERQIRVRDEGTLLHTGASALRFTGARLKSLAPSVGAHRAYEVPPAG